MKINEALKKYSLVPKKYKKIKSVWLIDTSNNQYIYKEKKPNINILDYLKTRSFNYLPKLISSYNDNYQITEYLKDYDIPKEQKNDPFLVQYMGIIMWNAIIRCCQSRLQYFFIRKLRNEF